MFCCTDIAVSLSAMCLVYNLALTGFRLSTFELYRPLEAVGTTASLALLNAAVFSLKHRNEDSMKILQILLAAGGLVLVNLDRLKNVVGERYKYTDVSGKVFIVTGSNTGIGYETARALLQQGGTVIMACRSVGKANEARSALLKQTKCDPSKVIVLTLDLCDLKVVREFVENFKKLRLPLHGLINNAGLMMDKRELTVDGMETMFVANHLSHFLLTNLLLPEIEKTGGRVVTLSSSVHNLASTFDFDNINGDKHYEMFSNYGQSKLANILFTRELARRLAASKSNVTCFSVHPGCVRTEVTRHMNAFMQIGNALFAPVLSAMQKTPEQGAYSSVHVATSPTVTGQLAGKLFFHCRPIPVSAAAQDAAAAVRLWELSERLCGIAK